MVTLMQFFPKGQALTVSFARRNLPAQEYPAPVQEHPIVRLAGKKEFDPEENLQQEKVPPCYLRGATLPLFQGNSRRRAKTGFAPNQSVSIWLCPFLPPIVKKYSYVLRLSKFFHWLLRTIPNNWWLNHCDPQTGNNGLQVIYNAATFSNSLRSFCTR